MKRQNKIFAVALVAIALAGAARAEPTQQVLLIRPGDITPRTDSDTTIATYYTVSYSPPRDLPAAVLERAILELYVDVGAKVRKEYVNEAPVLEVYALTQPFSDTLDPETLDRVSRVVQPVAAGGGGAASCSMSPRSSGPTSTAGCRIMG